MPGKLVQFEDGSWGWEDPLDYARYGSPPLVETLNEYMDAKGEDAWQREYAEKRNEQLSRVMELIRQRQAQEEVDRYRTMRNAVAGGSHPNAPKPPIDIYPLSVSLRAQNERGISPEAMELARRSNIKIAPRYLVAQEYGDRVAPNLTQREKWALPVQGFAGDEIWISSDFQDTLQPANTYTHELAHRWYSNLTPKEQVGFMWGVKGSDSPYGPRPQHGTDAYETWYGQQRPAQVFAEVTNSVANPNDQVYGGHEWIVPTETYATIAESMNEQRFQAMPEMVQDAYGGFFTYAPENVWVNPYDAWRK